MPALATATLSPAEELLTGLTAVMRRWSALAAAVSEQWGGSSSTGKAETLRQALHAQLTASKGIPDALDVEDYLFIFMEEEFSCQLEDGSPKDVATMLVDMAQQCAKNDFTLARQMVQYAEQERATLEGRKITVLEEGEMDDDDMMDEPSTNAEAPSAMADYSANSNVFADPNAPVYVDQGPARQLGEAAPEKVSNRVVDDDGFESVVPRRSTRKNKGMNVEQNKTWNPAVNPNPNP